MTWSINEKFENYFITPVLMTLNEVYKGVCPEYKVKERINEICPDLDFDHLFLIIPSAIDFFKPNGEMWSKEELFRLYNLNKGYTIYKKS